MGLRARDQAARDRARLITKWPQRPTVIPDARRTGQNSGSRQVAVVTVGVPRRRGGALMAARMKLRCPNCVRVLPPGLCPLEAGLPWLRKVAVFLGEGQLVYQCPHCSLVWKQLASIDKPDITPLGFYRQDLQQLQGLPTGFKAASVDRKRSKVDS